MESEKVSEDSGRNDSRTLKIKNPASRRMIGKKKITQSPRGRQWSFEIKKEKHNLGGGKKREITEEGNIECPLSMTCYHHSTGKAGRESGSFHYVVPARKIKRDAIAFLGYRQWNQRNSRAVGTEACVWYWARGRRAR